MVIEGLKGDSAKETTSAENRSKTNHESSFYDSQNSKVDTTSLDTSFNPENIDNNKGAVAIGKALAACVSVAVLEDMENTGDTEEAHAVDK